MSAHGRTRVRLSRRGFTLVEVLMALGVTALVGALVSSMIFSVSQGTKNQQDLRRRTIRADVFAGRVDGAVRSATKVLASGGSWVVLWKGDSRPNQKPNLSELHRIEWDAAGKRIRSYSAPAGLAEASDTAYELTADFGQITSSLAGSASFPGETWCEKVSAWQVGPAGAGQTTRLLWHAVTIDDAAGSSSYRSSVSLRAE